MKKLTLFIFLAILFAFTGCDKECSSLDCLQETFFFRLADGEGVNLMDNGTIKLEQIYMVPKPVSSTSTLVRLATRRHGNETWIEAGVMAGTGEYLLQIEGYDPQDLKLVYNVVKGKCCTSATIEEVYQNSKVTSLTGGPGRTLVLP